MNRLTHRGAILLMVCATVLWSIAGVLTRHLDEAKGFEVTFWRSVFAALFVTVALGWQQRGKAVSTLMASGRLGLISGVMWAIMFCCFMIALTMTTVANTLVVMSISPLLTAFFAWLFLRQRVPGRTWLAIAVAFVGMVWMFAKGMTYSNTAQMAGMLIALGVPIAASVNVITLKKAGQGIDLIPAIFMGGVISAICMLPFAWPINTSLHDLLILAILGFFQLAFPCMLMVKAAKVLPAPEISLLAMLEVLLGPLWAWLWANEVPFAETLIGGALVLSALVLNEVAAMRENRVSRQELKTS